MQDKPDMVLFTKFAGELQIVLLKDLVRVNRRVIQLKIVDISDSGDIT